MPNNRLEFALSRSTRKSEALLLAAQPGRSASRELHKMLRGVAMNARIPGLLIMITAVLAFAYHAPVAATNFTSVIYDEREDKLVVTIAYRGTHDNHQFSIAWGECRRLDDDRFQTYGLLVDSDPMDLAHQNFTKVLEIDMASHPCRPARLTVRTAAGFNRSLNIPKPKKKP